MKQISKHNHHINQHMNKSADTTTEQDKMQQISKHNHQIKVSMKQNPYKQSPNKANMKQTNKHNHQTKKT